MFAVLCKIFDRHFDSNDLVIYKVVLFVAAIGGLLAVKFGGYCVDFDRLALVNKHRGFDDFASFCLDKFERRPVLRKRLSKTRTLKVLNLFFSLIS